MKKKIYYQIRPNIDWLFLYIVYMILDKNILIKLTRPNIRFYKYKYDCKVGDYINIDVADLTYGSSELVRVKCDICGFERLLMYRKYIKNNNRQGYYTCSSKCSTGKKKVTFFEKYGFDSPLKCDEIKKRVKKTCIDKYGFDNPMKSPLVLKKKENTCFFKYGSINYVNSESFIKKMNDDYSVDNPMQSVDINNKRIKSSFYINEFDSVKYQGKYELDFLQMCKENYIHVSKPKFSIKYLIDDCYKIYLPDFFISDKNLIIEIKSSYFLNLQKEKNELKKEYSIINGYNYLLILDKDYTEFKKLLNI